MSRQTFPARRAERAPSRGVTLARPSTLLLHANATTRSAPGAALRFPWLLATIGLLFTLIMSACATTQAPLVRESAVVAVNRAPYYAGAVWNDVQAHAMRVGHWPVAYQDGSSPVVPSGSSPAMQSMLADMTAYLDSLGVSARILDGVHATRGSRAAEPLPPDVSFGCVPSNGIAAEDCVDESSGLSAARRQRVQLVVRRPSSAWTRKMYDVICDQGIDATLLITLEVGQYQAREVGRGNKDVVLGTSHVERLPWVTSLETPVMVLQFTGAIVDKDGQPLRIGAEGLVVRNAPLAASTVDAQRVITDGDVELLRSARRTDLPGAPLTWQEGLRTLVAQLMSRHDLLQSAH